VIDQDLFSVPQEQIIKTKVQRTILKGKTVYQAK
jgi:predicted amidohydrolase YtcJ